MMNFSPPAHDADGLTGAILAVEGIPDAAVLLNGPTGCKFYHGAVAEGQLPRESSYDPLRFLDEFYFGQPRVPATYLDGDDYVFGASGKLERILPVVASKGHAMIGVVNSPGAALIGDDLDRFVKSANLDVPCVTVESTGYSGTLEAGFQEAAIRVLQTLSPVAQPREPKTVNLMGMSICQKHWAGNIAELKRLLALCGVRVGAVLCAGSRVCELKKLRAASFNIMVHEESGDRLASWCEAQYGIKTLRPVNGAPFGFDGTEQWIHGVCEALGAASAPAIAAIDEARIRAVMHIKRLNSLTGLPKGATFAVRASASMALPLTQWLHGYLGMTPVAVDTPDVKSPLEKKLHLVLKEMGCGKVWRRSCVLEADCVFADGVRLARLEAVPQKPAGIEIALPSRGYIDIVDKCLLGANGSLHLLEWLLNALMNR